MKKHQKALTLILFVYCLTLSFSFASTDQSVFAWYLSCYGNEAEGWFNWAESGINPSTFAPNGNRNIASSFYPLIGGAYDSSDDKIQNYHIELAKAIGLTGFVADYYGKSTSRFRAYQNSLDTLLKKAEVAKLKIWFTYEPQAILNDSWHKTNRTKEQKFDAIKADLLELCQRYTNSSAYYRTSENKILIGFYENNEQELAVEECFEIKKFLLLNGFDVLLVGNEGHKALHFETNLESFKSGFDGLYLWPEIHEELSPAASPSYSTAKNLADISNSQLKNWVAAGSKRFGISSLWPGFDSTKVDWGFGSHYIDYQNGLNWDAVADSAYASSADMYIISTFNDWNEGTMIEPDMLRGTLYAEKCQSFIAKLRRTQANPSLIDTVVKKYSNKQVSNTITTTPAKWAMTAVKYLKDSNLYNESLFTNYQAQINREEFAALISGIYKAMGGYDFNQGETFKDLTNSKYKFQIENLRAMGIIKGITTDKFGPTLSIKRQDAFCIANNLIKIYKENRANTSTKVYADSNKISDYAQSAINNLTQYGLINGNQNRINPLGSISKEEACQIVYNILLFLNE